MATTITSTKANNVLLNDVLDITKDIVISGEFHVSVAIYLEVKDFASTSLMHFQLIMSVVLALV